MLSNSENVSKINLTHALQDGNIVLGKGDIMAPLYVILVRAFLE